MEIALAVGKWFCWDLITFLISISEVRMCFSCLYDRSVERVCRVVSRHLRGLWQEVHSGSTATNYSSAPWTCAEQLNSHLHIDKVFLFLEKLCIQAVYLKILWGKLWILHRSFSCLWPSKLNSCVLMIPGDQWSCLWESWGRRRRAACFAYAIATPLTVGGLFDFLMD